METVRYFSEKSEESEEGKERKTVSQGTKEAERVAMQGREWAGKVLRHEDMEVWFFRLLLE